MSPVRWGFLGAGFVATHGVAPAIASAGDAELVAVAARDPRRAQALAPSARAHDDYAALLADPEVDAVYISLTNEAHLDWTLRALEAGKHVLCEKPLGLTADQVAAMRDAAVDSDRLLVEAAWNRWHPRTRTAIALLRSGQLGTVTSVSSTFTFGGVPADNYRWDPARGGGALLDVGPYTVGAVLWALDAAGPESVVAGSVRSASGVDASTTARLQLGSAVADVRVAIDGPEAQELVVTTDRGRLELAAPAFTSHHEPSRLLVRVDDVETVEHFDPCDPYALMVQAVSRAARGDTSAWVMPLDESLAVARTLDAITAAGEDAS